MSASDNNLLSANQQAMLDLALACDLKISDPSQQEVIRAHHQQIKTQEEAMIYIKSVEDRIRSRRRVRTLPSRRGQARAFTGETLAGPPRP